MPLLHPPLMVLATLAAALLGGCVPVEHLDASPVTGQVVDRTTCEAQVASLARNS